MIEKNIGERNKRRSRFFSCRKICDSSK